MGSDNSKRQVNIPIRGLPSYGVRDCMNAHTNVYMYILHNTDVK